MNDILLPFFLAFLSDFLPAENVDEIAGRADIDCVDDDQLLIIEADCFWCFGKLLDGIQDVFTKGQPGLHRMIALLDSTVKRVEPKLAEWMDEHGIQYSHFAFRWMNCLLVREFALPSMWRVWDLFLSNHTKIASTTVYLCAAMLGELAPTLTEVDGSEFLIRIQSLSVDFWSAERMETILAQAFVYEKSVSLPPGRA
jgi:hypothetical protein